MSYFSRFKVWIFVNDLTEYLGSIFRSTIALFLFAKVINYLLGEDKTKSFEIFICLRLKLLNFYDIASFNVK